MAFTTSRPLVTLPNTWYKKFKQTGGQQPHFRIKARCLFSTLTRVLDRKTE